MADLEESIYKQLRDSPTERFSWMYRHCTNTGHSQSTALAGTRGHKALRTAEASTTECPGGTWTADSKTKGELPPLNPVKKKSAYYKVTCSVYSV